MGIDWRLGCATITYGADDNSQVLGTGRGVGHVALRLAKVHLLEIQGIDVPETVVREFNRVLQPGGRVALLEYEYSVMISEPQATVNFLSINSKYSTISAFDQSEY